MVGKTENATSQGTTRRLPVEEPIWPLSGEGPSARWEGDSVSKLDKGPKTSQGVSDCRKGKRQRRLTSREPRLKRRLEGKTDMSLIPVHVCSGRAGCALSTARGAPGWGSAWLLGREAAAHGPISLTLNGKSPGCWGDRQVPGPEQALGDSLSLGAPAKWPALGAAQRPALGPQTPQDSRPLGVWGQTGRAGGCCKHPPAGNSFPDRVGSKWASPQGGGL